MQPVECACCGLGQHQRQAPTLRKPGAVCAFDCVLQAVDGVSRALQHELSSTTELLASDAGRLSKELAAVRGDVATVAGALQQQQHELGVVKPRVSRLESLESSNPRASLRLVTALEGKVDNLAAQQVRGVYRGHTGTVSHPPTAKRVSGWSPTRQQLSCSVWVQHTRALAT